MKQQNARHPSELPLPSTGVFAKHLKTFEEGLQTSKEADRQAKSWIRGHAVRRGMLSEYLEEGKMVVRSLVVSHWSLARSSLW
jgi:hypothetical protein